MSNPLGDSQHFLFLICKAFLKHSNEIPNSNLCSNLQHELSIISEPGWDFILASWEPMGSAGHFAWNCINKKQEYWQKLYKKGIFSKIYMKLSL